jgi:uncharacterized protein (TIGR04255 family)
LVSRSTKLPERISPDAVNEVLFEIRFEMTTLPEVLLGRLVDLPTWSKFTPRNLPAYDMPAQMRMLNPALRFQPIVELVDSATAPSCALRIGPQVLLYQRFRSYGGWSNFKPEISQVINALFQKANDVTVRRLALRYANALRSDVHRVSGLSSLHMSVSIADEPLGNQTNLNFNRIISIDTIAGVKIATVDIVTGPLPPNTTVYVDCDVFTPDGYTTRDPRVIEAWAEIAHENAKREFFTLLTHDTIDYLVSNVKP